MYFSTKDEPFSICNALYKDVSAASLTGIARSRTHIIKAGISDFKCSKFSRYDFERVSNRLKIAHRVSVLGTGSVALIREGSKTFN